VKDAEVVLAPRAIHAERTTRLGCIETARARTLELVEHRVVAHAVCRITSTHETQIIRVGIGAIDRHGVSAHSRHFALHVRIGHVLTVARYAQIFSVDARCVRRAAAARFRLECAHTAARDERKARAHGLHTRPALAPLWRITVVFGLLAAARGVHGWRALVRRLGHVRLAQRRRTRIERVTHKLTNGHVHANARPAVAHRAVVALVGGIRTLLVALARTATIVLRLIERHVRCARVKRGIRVAHVVQAQNLGFAELRRHVRTQ